MTRIHSRLLGTVGLTASAALLTGCAVLGGDSGVAGVVSDDDLSTTYNRVQPGVLTVCSDIPYPPFEFELDGELTGYLHLKDVLFADEEAFTRNPDDVAKVLDEQGVEHVRAALTSAGSRSFVDDLATQQLREATTLAEDLGLPPELVTWVGEVAGSLEGGVA